MLGLMHTSKHGNMGHDGMNPLLCLKRNEVLPGALEPVGQASPLKGRGSKCLSVQDSNKGVP